MKSGEECIVPQKNTAKRFWDDRKSILLTRLVTGGVFIACILIALAGPAIVDWLITRGRVAVTGPAVRGVMLGLGYVLAALALWMLWQLERLLARLGQGAVFVPANVQALRRIAWCCALAAVICVPAGAALYFPFACMGIAAGFMALIVHVLKNAFEQAVKMQDELDYTV